ncbi:hypothetical protein [Burkholderia sp. USMB20]|uniref:hypothetical protein n=1 Tax=Burkholderia sp. USMB20 TaxID=1571773 RepID=UPI0005CE717C|nr:hypothetical protein [Burkholderia sp. USMB20]TGN94212.1 hypothetical protein PL79_025495 [Burkholderia sp. USMB20]
MNALRHFLHRLGVARQLLWILILVSLLSRALMSGAVMLDPDGPDAGSVVLCSGRGPLIIGATALTARFDASAPITPANDALALVNVLKHGTDAGKPASADSSNGVCAFSAALFAALVSFVLLVLLFPAAAPRRFRLPPDGVLPARSIFDDRPPSRAPPQFC